MTGSLGIFGVIALLGGGGAPDDAAKLLRSTATKLYLDSGAAYKAKDASFFDRILPSEFTSYDERHTKLGRKESLFVIRFQLNTLKVQSYVPQVKAIKLKGTTGTVTVSAKMMALMPARRMKPAENVEISRTWEDVFVQRPTGWTLVTRRELKAPDVRPIPLQPATPAKAHHP